jgi:hypothetical protein
MLQFHTCIYARPREASSGQTRIVGRHEVMPIDAPPTELLSSGPLTFDQAADALAKLPRMFLEPDGSFVWAGGEEDSAWQLDGVLYDQGARLACVELRGRCPPAALDDLLSALGWPEAPLLFQLLPQGLLVSEEDFRRLAGA